MSYAHDGKTAPKQPGQSPKQPGNQPPHRG